MNETHVVVFSLNGVPFGANAEEIEEVVRCDVLQKSENRNEGKEHNLPCMEGYAGIRGSMIPVVNLGKYLGFDESHVPSNAKIILVKTGENFTGFIVDNVAEIIRLDENSIKDAPRIITTPENECIEKFVIRGESLFPVIRFEKIINR